MLSTRKLALASAIAWLSGNTLLPGTAFGVELMEDESLREIVGQAGLTIDIETRIELGERAYKDAGFLLRQGLRIGGNSLGNGTGTGSDYLDNLRLTVDVAGNGSTPGDNRFDYGFSALRDIAEIYEMAGNTDPGFADFANGVDSRRGGLLIDEKRFYADGDLVIHQGFTDGWANEGGFANYLRDGRFTSDGLDVVEKILEQAVDFRREIDAVGLARSDYEVGSQGLDTDGNHTTGQHEGAEGTTTLVSQLGIQGYLGPRDMWIENRGNGFDGSGPLGEGTGFADSGIIESRYFLITDIDYYMDIKGIQFRDIKIHNRRGDLTGFDGTSSFGFAHGIQERRAVKDAVLKIRPALGIADPVPHYGDGVLVRTRLKADIDVEHISFGDTGESIGSYYLTDMVADTRRVISAH